MFYFCNYDKICNNNTFKGVAVNKIMINYLKSKDVLKDRLVNIITIDNKFNKNRTLLISKVSEAITPKGKDNHIGEGSTLNKIIKKKQGVEFIINGGFNHYRKDFYEWSHQNFNIGDPVGIVKIRNLVYNDISSNINHYGFFVQKEKHNPWEIISKKELNNYNYKYIMGCTPLLIYNGKKCKLPEKEMSFKEYSINPPSLLYHGNTNRQRTSVGIKDDKIYFILVDEADNLGGCTLSELQEIGLKLELDSLMNLDGGGSSQFKLFQNKKWLSNNISNNDKNRTLGNVFILFNEDLKNI